MTRRLACALVTLACGSDNDGSTPAATTDGGQDDSCAEGRACTAAMPTRGVDVLFIVDRSPRMGPAQAKLARAMPALVDAFDDLLARDVTVRVAFAVAENPLPPCPDATPAEPVLASCREHLDDFALPGAQDVTASACLDVCALESISVVPDGRTDGDGPWIEWDRHGSNLGEVDVAAALACAAPQGIAGCEFPAPIGATTSALERFTTPRRTAVVVIVSDAADCTLMDDGDLIFDPDSSQTFWTDPDADAPMPAICWNAGVTCVGTAAQYDSCSPADKDFAGEPAGWMARVLTHAEARVDTVTALGIVGVPQGWRRGDPIPFADAEDPAIQTEYGIGPGCVAADGSFGLPPVRVRAFVEANPYAPEGDTTLWSICADDWAPTMRAIAEVAGAQVRPNCVPVCVADLDAASGVQHDCTVTLVLPSEDDIVSEMLPQCEGSLDAATVPAGAPACWSPRVDASLSTQCRDEGWNLQIDLHWAAPAPAWAEILTSCTPSPDRRVDCPALP